MFYVHFDEISVSLKRDFFSTAFKINKLIVWIGKHATTSHILSIKFVSCIRNEIRIAKWNENCNFFVFPSFSIQLWNHKRDDIYSKYWIVTEKHCMGKSEWYIIIYLYIWIGFVCVIVEEKEKQRMAYDLLDHLGHIRRIKYEEKNKQKKKHKAQQHKVTSIKFTINYLNSFHTGAYLM